MQLVLANSKNELVKGVVVYGAMNPEDGSEFLYRDKECTEPILADELPGLFATGMLVDCSKLDYGPHSAVKYIIPIALTSFPQSDGKFALGVHTHYITPEGEMHTSSIQAIGTVDTIPWET